MPEVRVRRLQGVLLNVADVERSKEFYGKLLGLELTYDAPGEFATFGAGSIVIYLHAAHDAPPQVSRDVELVLDVEDVDAAVEHLRNHDVHVVHDPVDQPWGARDARVLDPDGYLISLSRAISD